MRKLVLFSATALLAGALAGSVQATPLSATGAMATRGVADQAMPDQGVVKVRWHHRHYGWRRGYQCVLQGFPKFPESIQRGLLTIAPHRSSVCVVRDRKSSVESPSGPRLSCLAVCWRMPRRLMARTWQRWGTPGRVRPLFSCVSL